MKVIRRNGKIEPEKVGLPSSHSPVSVVAPDGPRRLSGEMEGRPCTTPLKISRDQPLRGIKCKGLGVNEIGGRVWGKEKMRVERGDSVAGTGAQPWQ